MKTLVFLSILIVLSTVNVFANADFEDTVYLYTASSVDTSNTISSVTFGNAACNNICYWSITSITWKYNLNGYSLDADSTETDIDSAFDVWDNSTPDMFSFSGGGSTGYTLDPGNGNVIFFEDNPNLIHNVWNIPSTAPGSTFLTTSNNIIQNVDICLNAADFDFTFYIDKVSSEDEVTYLKRIVAHEIGHLLGLGHYGDLSSDLMNVTDKYEISYSLNSADRFALAFANGGRISQNCTIKDRDTYYLGHKDLNIDDNVTMTIELAPGRFAKTLYFYPNISLDVDGSIKIDDTGIEFLSTSGYWDGIDINNGGTLEVNYPFTIENAIQGISISGTGTIDNNNSGYQKITISDCSESGVYVNDCSPTVRKIEITDTSALSNSGITVTGTSADPLIQFNTVMNNQYGINIAGSSSDAVVDYCDIQTSNTSHSVYVNSNGYICLAGPSLNGNNNIERKDTSVKAVYNLGTGSIYAQNNFWGGTPSDSFFQNANYVDYSNHLVSSANAGADYGKIAVPRNDPFIYAQMLEFDGRYYDALDVYKQAIAEETDVKRKKFLVTSMLRTIDKYDRDYFVLRDVLADEMNTASGWYRACIDYILTGLLFREGNYAESAGEYVSKSAQYKGTSMEVEMLSRSAFIRGDYMNDKAGAKALADRAAAVNPGSYDVRMAYESAGIYYDHTKHTDRFAGKIENFDIQPEPKDESGTEKITQFVSVTPNPANPSTTITYSIAEPSHVKLVIYSVSGQKVANLVDGHMTAGKHVATFDGSNLASGVYFYSFESKGFTKTGKMLMIK